MGEFGHYQHRWAIVEHKDDHTPIHYADDRKPERAKSEKWDGSHLITMDKVRLHRKFCPICRASQWRTCNCKPSKSPEGGLTL